MHKKTYIYLHNSLYKFIRVGPMWTNETMAVIYSYPSQVNTWRQGLIMTMMIMMRWRRQQRRQSGLKSGDRESGQKNFDFPSKYPKSFDFLRQFH